MRTHAQHCWLIQATVMVQIRVSHGKNYTLLINTEILSFTWLTQAAVHITTPCSQMSLVEWRSSESNPQNLSRVGVLLPSEGVML